MKRPAAAILLAACTAVAQDTKAPAKLTAEAMAVTGIPVDLSVPTPPVPSPGADGKIHLVYELRVMNLSPFELHLDRIEVLGGNTTLANFEGAALSGMLTRPNNTVGPGLRTVAFLWLTLEPNATVPPLLRHRLTIDGHQVETSVLVASARPITIGPPVRGSGWFAGNGPSNTSIHRRTIMPIQGKEHDSQRFAIDWVKTGADGKRFTGDPKDNRSYLAYGTEVLAVADGVVVEVKDGIPENVPDENDRAVPMTAETIGGNHVILDLGGGRFAVYAHLQPGSPRVKVGQRVKRGQVLSLLGNSGNSTETHLHFQICDGPSVLGAEGLPYAFDSFAVVENGKATPRKNVLPLENQRINFPESR